MLFNSYIFILAFFPVAIILYYSLNHFGRYKSAQGVLVAMSLGFYAYFCFEYLFVLVGSIIVSPYKATSIGDFWKRWHITLTRFLTRYVYIPLGGSRKGKKRTLINILLVFLILKKFGRCFTVWTTALWSDIT